MKKIDTYSYQCGVIDCFNEMVKAGLKPLALAHPCQTKQERDMYLPFVETITQKYQTHYYLDDDPLITDLFPLSMNKDTVNIIFYKEKQTIDAYENLKKLKAKAQANHEYALYRQRIAHDFGQLLGYSDNIIQTYITSNQEKEEENQ